MCDVHHTSRVGEVNTVERLTRKKMNSIFMAVKDGGFCLVDEDTYQWAHHQLWVSNKSGYISDLHRVIMNARPGEHVHHRNEIKWDNRRVNLQIMTPSQHSRLHVELSRERRRKEIIKNRGKIIANT